MFVWGTGYISVPFFAFTNLWDQYIYIQHLTERTEMPLHGIVLLYALNYPLENKTLYGAFLWVLWQVIYEGIFYPVIDMLWGWWFATSALWDFSRSWSIRQTFTGKFKGCFQAGCILWGNFTPIYQTVKCGVFSLMWEHCKMITVKTFKGWFAAVVKVAWCVWNGSILMPTKAVYIYVIYSLTNKQQP